MTLTPLYFSLSHLRTLDEWEETNRGGCGYAKQCLTVTELTGQFCGPEIQLSHLKQFPSFPSLWLLPYNDPYFPASNQGPWFPLYISLSVPISFPSILWNFTRNPIHLIGSANADIFSTLKATVDILLLQIIFFFLPFYRP